MPKKRILFIVGPALGHVGRSLIIARSLAKIRPLEIYFACISPGFGPKTIGLEFPVSELTYEEKGDLEFAKSLEQVVAHVKADVLCLDLTPLPWLHQVSFPNVPQIYITNYFLTKLGREPTVQDYLYSTHRETYNDNRLLRGLSPLENSRELYGRDVVLLADPPALLSRIPDKLPTNYKVVGPCIWQPDKGNLQLSIQKASFLYFSLGSTGSQPLPVGLVNALADSQDAEGIVWVGPPPYLPHNFGDRYIYQHFNEFPASIALPNARLAITQGGAGSTYQALGHGTPVAIWPTHRNHQVLGKEIEKNGFGILLGKNWKNDIERLTKNLNLIKAHINDSQTDLSFKNSPTKAAHSIIGLLGIDI